MKPDILHDRLIAAVRLQLPEGANLAATLSDILSVGKEAVYRRLRGEVPFTFTEVAAISEKMNLSLNDIVGDSITGTTLFRYNNTRFFDPREYDYHHYENAINSLRSIENDPYTEMGTSSNSIAAHLVTPFESLARFRLFKWDYLHMGKDHPVSYCDVAIPPKMRDMELEFSRLMNSAIKKTYYVWDSMAFQYFINDLKYFHRIHLIADDELNEIKKNAHQLIDSLEEMASRGVNPAGNKVEIYIASTNFETAYTYIQASNSRMSLIRVFTLDSIWSADEPIFNKLRKWILSLRRQSILISESGEMHRVQFFRRQRKFVDSL